MVGKQLGMLQDPALLDRMVIEKLKAEADKVQVDSLRSSPPRVREGSASRGTKTSINSL